MRQLWVLAVRWGCVAPPAALDPGQTYAVASGDPRKAEHFVVRAEGELPLLMRVWPPVDTPAHFGIFCGTTHLPDVAVDVKLDPLGLSGTLSRGITASGPGGDCLRFRVKGCRADEQGWPVVLPPVVEMSGGGWGLVQIDRVGLQGN